MKISLYRRAVKIRWPKSYRENQVVGDGRWVVVSDEYELAMKRGYKGFIWTTLYLHETEAQALSMAANLIEDGVVAKVIDVETLPTFAQAKRIDGYLTKPAKTAPAQLRLSMKVHPFKFMTI